MKTLTTLHIIKYHALYNLNVNQENNCSDICFAAIYTCIPRELKVQPAIAILDSHIECGTAVRVKDTAR